MRSREEQQPFLHERLKTATLLFLLLLFLVSSRHNIPTTVNFKRREIIPALFSIISLALARCLAYTRYSIDICSMNEGMGE
jgi:purine-cytosine permease-like protein